MPKITWLKQPKPKINYLAALFHAYRIATGMTSAEIGKEVGCSASNARAQMAKAGTEWNIGRLLKYCDALGIPYEDAFKAAIE